MTVERFRTVTATGDVLVTDRYIFGDTTAGSVTLTLPPAAQMIGRVLTFDKTIAANTLTLDADGSELIDGATTLAWTTQYLAKSILSDGLAWYTV